MTDAMGAPVILTALCATMIDGMVRGLIPRVARIRRLEYIAEVAAEAAAELRRASVAAPRGSDCYWRVGS